MSRRKPAARRTSSSRPSGGDRCPCGNPRFDQCCERVLADSSTAESPEALMRSRYTAHVVGDSRHLATTWHPDTAPPDIAASGPDVRWLGLDIVDADDSAGDAAGDHAHVEFRARFRRAGQVDTLHERSRFVLTLDGWRYLDGRISR